MTPTPSGSATPRSTSPPCWPRRRSARRSSRSSTTPSAARTHDRRRGRDLAPDREPEATAPLLDVSVVIDDSLSDDFVALGLGLSVRTVAPPSRTTIHVPLFRTAKKDRSVPDPFLLGAVGGRIQVATEVTVGDPHLASIGLGLDVPTATGDGPPSFSLTLRGMQLPGAPAPRDITVGGTGLDDLDDAVLDLVLSLVRAQLGARGRHPAARRRRPARPR